MKSQNGKNKFNSQVKRWGETGTRQRRAAIPSMSESFGAFGTREKGSKLRCFGKGSENLQHLFCMAISYDYTVCCPLSRAVLRN